MAKQQDELKQLAEVVAISAEDQEQTQKMDQLLAGAFTLLRDPNLEVTRAYHMEHRVGSSTIANMGRGALRVSYEEGISCPLVTRCL